MLIIVPIILMFVGSLYSSESAFPRQNSLSSFELDSQDSFYARRYAANRDQSPIDVTQVNVSSDLTGAANQAPRVDRLDDEASVFSSEPRNSESVRSFKSDRSSSTKVQGGACGCCMSCLIFCCLMC